MYVCQFCPCRARKSAHPYIPTWTHAVSKIADLKCMFRFPWPASWKWAMATESTSCKFVCVYVCMYVRFRVKTGQTYIHSPFPRRRARKTQHTFQNGRKKVGMAPCRYVWMGRFPRPAWAKLTNIHTYATSKNLFV